MRVRMEYIPRTITTMSSCVHTGCIRCSGDLVCTCPVCTRIGRGAWGISASPTRRREASGAPFSGAGPGHQRCWSAKDRHVVATSSACSPFGWKLPAQSASSATVRRGAYLFLGVSNAGCAVADSPASTLPVDMHCESLLMAMIINRMRPYHSPQTTTPAAPHFPRRRVSSGDALSHLGM